MFHILDEDSLTDTSHCTSSSPVSLRTLEECWIDRPPQTATCSRSASVNTTNPVEEEELVMTLRWWFLYVCCFWLFFLIYSFYFSAYSGTLNGSSCNASNFQWDIIKIFLSMNLIVSWSCNLVRFIPLLPKAQSKLWNMLYTMCLLNTHLVNDLFWYSALFSFQDSVGCFVSCFVFNPISL